MFRLRSDAVGILILLVVAIAARALGWIPSVINPDESIFSLAAREVISGHLPYVTMFDNKPVGSTLILAGAFALFGQSVLVARLVGLIAAWVSGVLVSALLRGGGFGRGEALVGGAVQIAFVSAIGLGGQATLTELMLTPFTIGAALLLQRTVARPGGAIAMVAGAGLACGIAVLIKIVPLLPGLAIAGTTLLLAVLRARLTWVRAGLLMAVFAGVAVLPMLAAAALYLGNGALDLFWWSNFGFAGAYTGTHPSAAVMVTRLGRTIDVLWPLLALAAVGVLAVVVTWRRERSISDLLIVATAWVVAEAGATAPSLQFFPHYFLAAVAPLAVLAAYGARAVARWAGAIDRPRIAVVLGTIAALIALERSQMDFVRERLAEPDVPARIATAIRRGHTDQGAPTLFVTNYKLSGIYLLTGSPLPPTRIAVPAHLFSRQAEMTRADPKAEVARVLASRPAFIVLDDAEPLPGWARRMFDRIAPDYRLFYTQGTARVLQRVAPERGGSV